MSRRDSAKREGPAIEEHERILEAYRARERRAEAKGSFFGLDDLAHLCRIQERQRETLRLLVRFGFHPLSPWRILDVGCGDGNGLRQFLQWGAQPERLSGIELRPDPVAKARRLSPNLDVRCGSAAELPWPDASFDLACQATVFTSILDTETKRKAASEMSRVVRPGGAVLWYDFRYENPRNPDVRGVKPREIERLFPGFAIALRRITLAPPIARRIPAPLLPIVYPLLASVPFLRTHDLGLLVKPR